MMREDDRPSTNKLPFPLNFSNRFKFNDLNGSIRNFISPLDSLRRQDDFCKTSGLLDRRSFANGGVTNHLSDNPLASLTLHSFFPSDDGSTDVLLRLAANLERSQGFYSQHRQQRQTRLQDNRRNRDDKRPIYNRRQWSNWNNQRPSLHNGFRLPVRPPTIQRFNQNNNNNHNDLSRKRSYRDLDAPVDQEIDGRKLVSYADIVNNNESSHGRRNRRLLSDSLNDRNDQSRHVVEAEEGEILETKDDDDFEKSLNAELRRVHGEQTLDHQQPLNADQILEHLTTAADNCEHSCTSQEDEEVCEEMTQLDSTKMDIARDQGDLFASVTSLANDHNLIVQPIANGESVARDYRRRLLHEYRQYTGWTKLPKPLSNFGMFEALKIFVERYQNATTTTTTTNDKAPSGSTVQDQSSLSDNNSNHLMNQQAEQQQKILINQNNQVQPSFNADLVSYMQALLLNTTRPLAPNAIYQQHQLQQQRADLFCPPPPQMMPFMPAVPPPNYHPHLFSPQQQPRSLSSNQIANALMYINNSRATPNGLGQNALFFNNNNNQPPNFRYRFDQQPLNNNNNSSSRSAACTK